MRTSRWPIQEKHYLGILIVLAAVFFVIYAWFSFAAPAKFTSPDETANYYFIRLFSEKSQLHFSDQLNQTLGGIVQPRSMGYSRGYTVPGSFLGIILLYGLLAKIIGVKLILLATPFISAVTVVFFYLLLDNIFSKKIAFLSAVLLFVLPPFWYYSSRGLFHNVLFIDFLIIGLYFLVRAFGSACRVKAVWLFTCVGSVCVGLALIIRTSEVIWVGFVLAMLFVLYRRTWHWWQLVLCLFIIALLFSPILYFNNQLYGSPLSFVYAPGGGDESTVATSPSTTILLKVQQILLPFGFHLSHISSVAYAYLITIMPWFSIGIIIALFWLLRQASLSLVKKILPEFKYTAFSFSARQKTYVWLFSAMTLWLLIYYGSYEFSEYFDRTKTILGSSYLRYWLPVYIFGLPLCVLGFEKIRQMFTGQRVGRVVMIILFVSFSLFSVNLTLLDPRQGLAQLKQNRADEEMISDVANQATPSNAVIISGFSDKVFFPVRQVIVSMPTDPHSFTRTVLAITATAPLYFYYNPLDASAVGVQSLFSKQGYTLEVVKQFPDSNTTLYAVLNH